MDYYLTNAECLNCKHWPKLDKYGEVIDPDLCDNENTPRLCIGYCSDPYYSYRPPGDFVCAHFEPIYENVKSINEEELKELIQKIAKPNTNIYYRIWMF